MPTWGEILTELMGTRTPQGVPDFDHVRRRYLSQLHALTGRDTIIYYTDWLTPNADPSVMINLEDVPAFMEVCKDLKGPELDLVLHTPGGQPEACASVVDYLRQKYTYIRVFVPVAAMSAGTMLSLACDEIVMGKHSQLGPIDPQMPTGRGYAPARAIVQQFERAKREIAADPAALQAWFPILQQYGVSLLEECEAAEDLGRGLVSKWLTENMFSALGEGAAAKAEEVTHFFADFQSHHSHSLGIKTAKLEELGLKITHLEDQPALQDAVLSVHHATMHTFQGPAVKIVENNLNRAYVKLQQPFVGVPNVQVGPGMLAPEMFSGVLQ